jgi:hypothetical protein
MVADINLAAVFTRDIISSAVNLPWMLNRVVTYAKMRGYAKMVIGQS